MTLKKSIFILCVLLYTLQLLVTNVAAYGEIDINSGLKENAGGVYTLPARTYTISGQVQVPDGTTLRGEVSESGELLTKLVLDNNVKLGNQEPIVSLGNDCKVLYLDFDGNSENQANVPIKKNKQTGNGFHNFIGAKYKNNIEVAYCNFYNNLGDGLRLHHGKNISFHDNRAAKGGHDVCYLVQSENCKIYNNYVEIRVNSAARFMDVNHGRIYNNTIIFDRATAGDAGPSIQIQNDDGIMRDVEVCGNYIYDPGMVGFWFVGKTGDHDQELWVHHNVIMGAGNGKGWCSGGVVASGYDNIIIENNVFDGSFYGAVNFWPYAKEWATKSTATMKNNIFIDSRPNLKENIGGWGINKEIAEQTALSSENCYYNNAAGNTRGCDVSSSDYYTNPKQDVTLCDIKWDGQRWVIPGVEPKVMGDTEGVYDDVDPITEEELEKFEFNNIFDVLDLEYSESATSNQTIDDINYTVRETPTGKIAAVIKIVGFKDIAVIDNVPYIESNDSILIKHSVIRNPDLVSWSGGIKENKKEIKTSIVNGTAYANMTVKTSWYNMKKNLKTGKRTKDKTRTSVYEFSDVYPNAPKTLVQPVDIHGTINVYPTFFQVFVPSNNLVKIGYAYDGNSSEHLFLTGTRNKTDLGVIYTEYSSINRWNGELEHQGDWINVFGVFDQTKLNVTAYTPYNEIQVTEFDIIKHDFPERAVARWFYPLIVTLLILFLYIMRLRSDLKKY